MIRVQRSPMTKMECPICGDSYESLKCLLCAHTICSKCLKDASDKEIDKCILCKEPLLVVENTPEPTHYHPESGFCSLDCSDGLDMETLREEIENWKALPLENTGSMAIIEAHYGKLPNGQIYRETSKKIWGMNQEKIDFYNERLKIITDILDTDLRTIQKVYPLIKNLKVPVLDDLQLVNFYPPDNWVAGRNYLKWKELAKISVGYDAPFKVSPDGQMIALIFLDEVFHHKTNQTILVKRDHIHDIEFDNYSRLWIITSEYLVVVNRDGEIYQIRNLETLALTDGPFTSKSIKHYRGDIMYHPTPSNMLPGNRLSFHDGNMFLLKSNCIVKINPDFKTTQRLTIPNFVEGMLWDKFLIREKVYLCLGRDLYVYHPETLKFEGKKSIQQFDHDSVTRTLISYARSENSIKLLSMDGDPIVRVVTPVYFTRVRFDPQGYIYIMNLEGIIRKY